MSKSTILATVLVVIVSILGFSYWQSEGVTIIGLTLRSNPGLEDGLVGHWTFDGESMVSNVADTSGEGNHGALQGQNATSSKPGVIGQALEFDGADEYVQIPDDSSLDLSSEGTLSSWIKADTLTGNDVIVSKVQCNEFSYYLSVNDGKLFWSWDNDGECSDVSSAQSNDTVITAGLWYHVAAVHTTDGVILYVNGAAVSDTLSGSYSSIFNSSKALRIGSYTNANGSAANFFDGLIDDVRIYNRALTAEEIQRLYDLGATTHVNVTLEPQSGGTDDLKSGLVGHWTFDGKDMTSNIADKSGQGNHGSLVGQTSTTTAIGKIGQALEFDGSDDYVSLGTGVNLNGATSFSVSLWFYDEDLGTFDAFRGIFGIGTTAQRVPYIYGSSANTAIVGHIETNGGATDCNTAETGDNPQAVDNTWIHVVLVWYGSSCRMYENGVAKPLDSMSGTTLGTANLEARIGDADTFDEFKGRIDDVRIYNRALSAEEIQRLYELGA